MDERALPGDRPSLSTSVVVVGAAKSGTSALFSAIRSTGDWLAIYETNNQRQVAFLTNHRAPQRLTKILLSRVVNRSLDLSGFSRRVHLVRDPRDLLVSWMLFRPLLSGATRNPAFLADFLAALRRKEADPAAVSLADLEAVFAEHGVGRPFAERFSQAFADERAVCARYPDLHRLRYEDFLAGDIGAVSEYLGLAVPTQVRVGAHIGHNERSKSAGGWRHWFTPADVDTYRPLFEAQLTRHGYDTEWTLAEAPYIDPATSSGYLERNRDRHRLVGSGRAEMLGREDYTDERLAVLASGVADGREAAMIELAFVHLRGLGAPRDPETARALLDDAAARGNAYAMVYLGLGARYRVPGFDPDGAAFFGSAARILGRRRTAELTAELDRAWRAHVRPALGTTRSLRIPAQRLRPGRRVRRAS